jgi:cyclophilin family peptidyl-prolyl cis-trans isomerase
MGAGYVRFDVPVGHEKFGKLESCVCRAKDVASSARNRLFALSNLERLGNLTFENFNVSGNEKAKFMTPQERESLHQAFEVCEEFARSHAGWLLLEGGYGCGKTHLAAAIANNAVSLWAGGNAIFTLMLTPILFKTESRDTAARIVGNESAVRVAHILDLIKRNFYNGQRISRVAPGFVVQYGDPLSRDLSKKALWNTGGSFKIVGELEASPKRTHTIGAVALAHDGDPRRSDSIMYITMREAHELDGKYNVIGHILSGMPILRATQIGDVIRRVSVTQ